MKIFIGYDSSYETDIDAKVCWGSLYKYNHDVTFLDKRLVETHGYNRQNEDGATAFTYTRFLVPKLCGYEGVALYMDSDFVWMVDPEELMGYYDENKAVHVVKHDKMPVRSKTKMNGRANNEYYPCKWWSSLMLFNCGHQKAKRLTADYVNTASPEALHRFSWAGMPDVGELPVEYNYLIGYYANDIHPKALHFTDGTPFYHDYPPGTPHAGRWREFA